MLIACSIAEIGLCIIQNLNVIALRKNIKAQKYGHLFHTKNKDRIAGPSFDE